MSASRIIVHYESLSDLIDQMREAATSGKWEQLLDLEKQCSHHVASMRLADVDETPDGPSRQRKIQLIKKILANDAEIRNHTEVWMEQLLRIMQSNRQEQRLQNAYGGN